MFCAMILFYWLDTTDLSNIEPLETTADHAAWMINNDEIISLWKSYGVYPKIEPCGTDI